MLQELSVARAKKSILLAKTAQSMSLGQYSEKDIDANIAANNAMLKSFDDWSNAVKNAKSNDEINNLKVNNMSYQEQIGIGNAPAPTPVKPILQTTPASQATPQAAPQTQARSGRVLSTIK